MLLETILRKSESLDRCLARIREEYDGRDKTFPTDYRRQDSIVLNLQRACEQCIDVAQVLLKYSNLKRPRKNAELFQVLADNQVIMPDTAARLRAIVGFRDIAVHEYQALSLEVLETIITTHFSDLRSFIDHALEVVASENDKG